MTRDLALRSPAPGPGGFRKLLVANRGEIAVRVIRACRELGIRPVAIFSEADRDALHVRLADEAWPCGPAAPRNSYLDVEGLMEIARRSQVDALHPGYGFLAENPELAERCASSGIAFVGPPASVIRRMGDKLACRRAMVAAGIEVVPGTLEPLTDAEVLGACRRLGFPVMVKASAGGGGRGLRRVDEEGEIPAALARARSEASSAFGDDTLYLEKALAEPRHVEVQLLADAHGRVLHLFERECSIQRRHQKLLEEAPAPGLDGPRRQRLYAAAVAAGRAVGYCGAGTCEFLQVGDAFYFLEMNTRIQVEHTVSEAITSVDLVKAQICVAAGEPLALEQEELSVHGHAIEARIYAEDPDKGFLPSAGQIRVWRPPAGPGIRVDAGVATGSRVTPHYDALLAKLVAWGRDRPEAVARLGAALREFAVAGVRTTLPFHRRVVDTRAFQEGRIHTGFAGDQAVPQPPPQELRELAHALAALAALGGSPPPEPRRIALREGSLLAELRLEGTPGGALQVAAPGGIRRLDVCACPSGSWSVLEAGRQTEASLAPGPGGFEVQLAGHVFRVKIESDSPVREGEGRHAG